jgi:C4-dicarboxylate transporter DctM subunit
MLDQVCPHDLASVIPPSIVFIVYGTVTNTSIGSLFVAGVIPGVVTGLGFMLVAYIVSRQNNWGGGEPFCWREFWAALRSAWLALVAPVVIVGGIRFGYFTPTEAGGIAVAYAFIVGMYVYRELTWKTLFAQLKETTETTGGILFIIATASVFGWILAAEQAPQMVLAIFDNITDSPTLVVLLLMATFLILGTFMDVLAIIFITAPVFMPLLARYDIDPVYFGVLMTMNLEIAANTPPLAIDLMAACRVARIPMSDSFRYLGAFLGVMVAVMLLILFFPNMFLFMR